MYIFDSGPLSSFAKVDRLDILAMRYVGNAGWTIEVEAEIEVGARLDPALERIRRESWFGPPIVLSSVQDLVRLERFRWALGGSEVEPSRHRGEAATLSAAVALGGVAVLDDGDARRFARANQIPMLGTIGILKAAVKARDLTPGEASAVVRAMLDQDRRLPEWADEAYFAS